MERAAAGHVPFRGGVLLKQGSLRGGRRGVAPLAVAAAMTCSSGGMGRLCSGSLPAFAGSGDQIGVAPDLLAPALVRAAGARGGAAVLLLLARRGGLQQVRRELAHGAGWVRAVAIWAVRAGCSAVGPHRFGWIRRAAGLVVRRAH